MLPGASANNSSPRMLVAWEAAEQLFALRATAWKDTEQKKKKKKRHGSPNSTDTEQVRVQVRKSESDSPNGQVRASTPHRTHQVLTLFYGRNAIMFYRLWVFMGLCG